MTKIQKIMKSVTLWADKMGVINRNPAPITRTPVHLVKYDEKVDAEVWYMKISFLSDMFF